MTVLRRRNRMISVRLSEEEYSALMRLRSMIGARSISDLARDAMRVFLNSVAHEDRQVDPSAEFRAQIVLLNQKIENLAGRIASSTHEVKS